MDVLVEMTPGNGWLARENDRIVYLPNDETVDIAHDVIEPLLIPRDIDESFATLREWIHSGRPLPSMMLVSLTSALRLMAFDVPTLTITEAATNVTHDVTLGTTTEVMTVGEVTTLVANDPDTMASGMLVEGVVRASGLRLHMHRGWDAVGPRDTNVSLPISNLELELDGQTIMIGNGLVIGRWPYSHPDFNNALEPLILGDPAVSRLHAVVMPLGDGISVDDRGSHNGSWVIRASGETMRIMPDEPQPLSSGDQLRVGDTTLKVR